MIALQEKTLKRMARLCRAVSVIFYITAVVAALAALLGMLYAVFGIFGYEWMLSEGIVGASEPGFSHCEIVVDGITLALYSLIVCASFFIAARLFGTVARTRRPFVRERARELKGVAWLNIVASILPALVSAAISLGAFATPYVPDGFSIDYDTIIGSLVLLAFSYIFDYGCVLQQQDDELL